MFTGVVWRKGWKASRCSMRSMIPKVAESKTSNKQLGGQRYDVIIVLVSGCSVALWSTNGHWSFRIMVFNDLPGCRGIGNMRRNGVITNVSWLTVIGRIYGKGLLSMACNDTILLIKRILNSHLQLQTWLSPM